MKLILLSILLYTGLFVNPPFKPSAYFLKAKLISGDPKPIGCGVIAWAFSYKFEILETSADIKKGTVILLNQRCPDFLGNYYFVDGKTYNIKAVLKIDNPESYLLVNPFEKENLPQWWIEEINPINN